MPNVIMHMKMLVDCAKVLKSVGLTWLELKYGTCKDVFMARNIAKVVVIALDDSTVTQVVAKCVCLNNNH